MCALDTSGNIILELLCNWKMKYVDDDRLFKYRIEEKSTLYVDSHKSYIRLNDNFDVDYNKLNQENIKRNLSYTAHKCLP